MSGFNDLEMFKQSTKDFGDDERYGRRVNRVCDFTDADMAEVSTLDFLRYANFSRRLPVSRTTKIALVGTKQHNVLMMFVNYMTSLNIKMFKQVEDAIHWVCDAEATNDILEPVTAVKYHQLSGALTVRRALELQNAWFGDENFDPDLPIVWDIREAEILASMPELDEGADRMFSRRESDRVNGRSAIVVASRQQEIMVKNAFVKGINAGHLGVFLNEQKAVDWVTLSRLD